MKPGGKRRGQPVVALALILGGWIAVRLVLAEQGEGSVPGVIEAPVRAVAVASPPAVASRDGPSERPEALARPALAVQHDRTPLRAAPAVIARPVAKPFPQPVSQSVPVTMASGHLMLWMAAVARVPDGVIPATLPVSARIAAPAPVPAAVPASAVRRWSADSWLMLRRGGEASLAAGAAPATYGASQMGGVLRYRLAPSSGHRPTAYVRATAALNRSDEREGALGLSARPVAALPLRVGAELRVTDNRFATRLRPAVVAVSELPPFALPGGLRGEAYVQAGYVGGKAATAFADGQLRADRPVARIGGAELRAGAGAWGGAQQGAARFDLGPAASLSLAIRHEAVIRLGADWRFRVTGNARPASGPALTISAGF